MGRKPKDTTHPPKMTHMMLAGAIPLEGVGYVLAEMYQRGAVHFEHQPFFLIPPPAPTGVTAGVGEEVLQLPAPHKKKQKMDGNIAETCADIVRAGHGKPVHTGTIGKGMVKAGFARSSTSGALQRAMKLGLVKRVGAALYLPAHKNGGKPQRQAPKGSNESQHAVVAKTIERAYPKWVKRAKLLRIFEKKGWRPESSSVATSKLKADGKIILGETEETKGTYQWVPENKRRTPSENPPADSQ
jgi:hypothetical protein